MSSDPQTVTRLLAAVREGDEQAMHALFPLVYDDLRQRAHQQRQRWHGNYTLNTTALIHEAYLKLVDQDEVALRNRAHFMGVAAKAMRHILIDYARERQAQKRGGDIEKVTFEEMKGLGEISMSDDDAASLLGLHEALERLAQRNVRQANIVECRFFGGMTIKETADALGVSVNTVKRGWEAAKAWLYLAMQDDGSI